MGHLRPYEQPEAPPEIRKCCDCASEFLFEAGEQKYFKNRGYAPPKRCPECRRVAKEKRTWGKPHE